MMLRSYNVLLLHGGLSMQQMRYLSKSRSHEVKAGNDGVIKKCYVELVCIRSRFMGVCRSKGLQLPIRGHWS
jgi:hypothetical protein